MENWLQTKALKRKEHDHAVLHVGSANSAQVVSKYDNISRDKEISSGSCSKKIYV